MNLSRVFILRPIATTLLTLAIVLMGLIGYRSLPVSDLPSVDFPTIQVSANLAGASPETMASAVATPLEQQFSSIAGLDSLNSVSSSGSTQITLQFTLDRSIDSAAQDVQSAISKAIRQLPSTMTAPPSFRKVNPADDPILYLVLSSDLLPLSTLDRYAENRLAQQLSMIDGVAQVQVYGAQKYAVRILANPESLRVKGIGWEDLAAAIAKGNVNLPTGTLYGRERNLSIETNGSLNDAAAYRSLVVAYREGAPVQLGELAKVSDSVENDRLASWYNGQRSIVLAVSRQPGTNTVAVVDRIKTLLPRFQETLPAAVQFNILYDRSQAVRESVNDVKFTLYLSLVLVVLVIFLFLRDLTATIIASLALPVSLLGTFAVMALLDYSLDTISLMALTLCVGFVVDDAIVMLENIARHAAGGKSPLEAALQGSREIGFTILSMTISLVAVFIPVLFMGGILGRLFREFAVTISVAILVSGLVSLTLTPMLCGRFPRPASPHRDDRTPSLFLRIYAKTLQIALKYAPMTMAISLGILIVTIHLFTIIPKGFIPNTDIGQIIAITEAAPGISFEEMVAHQQILAAIARRDPAVAAVNSTVGAGGPNSVGNTGRIFLQLKPRHERAQGAEEIVTKLRPKMASVPGIGVFLLAPPAIRLGGQQTKALYQYTLTGPSFEELATYTPKLLAKLKERPELQDVNSDLQIGNPQLRVDIDRDRVSALGLTAEQIETTLNNAYGTRQVSTIYGVDGQYPVILGVDRDYQAASGDLDWLTIRSSTGQSVPLDTVAEIRKTVGPLTINHLGQLAAVTISFNLSPGISIGTATPLVKKLAIETLPATISGSFQGSAQVFESSLSGLGILLGLAILVIYLVLGILYEDFIHPLTILSSLPSAGFGALITLLLFGMDLNIYAFVGIILLVGIVKKNGIMMVDFAIDRGREGKSPRQAIYEACLVRFRPIMMTTMAALMGTLPIALGLGAGGEARRPLGLAVVGGLLFSQFLTLYLTPVFYLVVESLRHRIVGKR